MPLPRVFISTDLRLTSEEKDDAQSLIHALLYQDRMNIVGISGTASKYGHQNGLVGDIDKVIDVYAQDHAKLKARSPAFKSAAELKALSWQGATGVAPSAGYSQPTDSSRAIIAEAKKAAAAGEKLNVLTWGGETDMAQALRDDPSIAPHVRFFNISFQDVAAYNYIKANFRGKLDLWVDDQSTFRGMYQTPTSTEIIKGWHDVHAKGHGALGNFFAQLSGDIFNAAGVKMGDSPTVLRFLSGNQNDPTQESWGGEFIKVSDRYYTCNPDPALDLGDRANTKGAMTIYEDRSAWLNSFAERFDWLKDGGTTPVTPTGPDTITVRVCGSALNGDPNFALTLNGRVIDATNLVTADQAEGEWETFTFRGTFVTAGVTTYRLGVEFTNDAFQAGVGDRNLWVDEVSLNGVVNTADQALRSNGTATWDIQLAGSTPVSGSVNLLVNGSFEATAVAADNYGSFQSMTGWTALSGARIELWNAHKGVVATQGANFAELDHQGALDGFYQDVQTTASRAYALSFDLRSRPDRSISTQSVEVLWNGAVVATAVPTTAWRTFTVGVTGTGARDRLTIREVGSQGGDGWGALLDNFRLVAAGTTSSVTTLAAAQGPELGASLT